MSGSTLRGFSSVCKVETTRLAYESMNACGCKVIHPSCGSRYTVAGWADDSHTTSVNSQGSCFSLGATIIVVSSQWKGSISHCERRKLFGAETMEPIIFSMMDVVSIACAGYGHSSPELVQKRKKSGSYGRPRYTIVHSYSLRTISKKSCHYHTVGTERRLWSLRTLIAHEASECPAEASV